MSVQKSDHASVKVVIAGNSGVGKTELLLKLLKRLRAKWIFIFDHKEGDLQKKFGVRACRTIEDLEAAVARGGLVIFDFRTFNDGMFLGRREEAFEFWCEWVFPVCKVIRGVKAFVADELQALIDDRSNPDALVTMLDECRTFQIDCFFCASALNEIHNRVRKQFTEIFAFRHGDKNGTAWLEEKGFDRGELLTLKNGLFVYKNLNTGAESKGGKAFVPKNATRDLRGL